MWVLSCCAGTWWTLRIFKGPPGTLTLFRFRSLCPSVLKGLCQEDSLLTRACCALLDRPLLSTQWQMACPDQHCSLLGVTAEYQCSPPAPLLASFSTPFPTFTLGSLAPMAGAPQDLATRAAVWGLYLLPYICKQLQKASLISTICLSFRPASNNLLTPLSGCLPGFHP